MTRGVLDTNVLVSALLQPAGLPATVLIFALSRRIQPCVSAAILAEYEEVIRRPHFKRDLEVIEATLDAIRKASHCRSDDVVRGM
jgi:putative PIN family toxin of toxin-antitoxin system